MVNSGYDNRLVVSTPLENMKVSWDDYSQYMENKIHVPNHQPVMVIILVINGDQWRLPSGNPS